MFSTASPSPAPMRAASLIGNDVVISGVLQSAGDIQVDGQVDGDVRCAALTIGENGIIRGDVRAETIVVRGTVDGSVTARAVMVAAGGHVEGDILHERLEVESGAFIEGHFRHVADALADTLPDAAQDETPDRRRPGSPMRAVEDEDVDAPVKIAAAG